MEQAHKLWIERCENVHEKVSEFETKQQQMRAERLLRAAYRHQENVLREDRDQIFAIPLEERLQQPAKTIISWYQDTKKVIKQAVKKFGKGIRQRKAIPRFFRIQERPQGFRNESRRRNAFGTLDPTKMNRFGRGRRKTKRTTETQDENYPT